MCPASSTLLNERLERAQLATGCSQQARKMSARSRSVNIEKYDRSRRRRQHAFRRKRRRPGRRATGWRAGAGRQAERLDGRAEDANRVGRRVAGRNAEGPGSTSRPSGFAGGPLATSALLRGITRHFRPSRASELAFYAGLLIGGG